jgi:hypothetical protein
MFKVCKILHKPDQAEANFGCDCTICYKNQAKLVLETVVELFCHGLIRCSTLEGIG